jgi:hypothetical protein
MINFNAYGFKSQDMTSDRLEVGQKLIRIMRPRRYESYDEITTAEYTIVKILKTRVVVEPTENPASQLRLIVDQRKWSIRQNEVTTDIEGSRDGWNRPSYEFATEDEAELIAQIIEHRAAQVRELKVRNEAAATVRQIASTLHPNLESVEAAIVALQALAAQMKGE